jgi:hypothetical protein
LEFDKLLLLMQAASLRVRSAGVKFVETLTSLVAEAE